MKKLLLFGGTTEGRQLAEGLVGGPWEVLASVATDYGKSLLPTVENLRVRVGRLEREEIAGLLEREAIQCAVDATHPYATKATENLAAACDEKGIPYYRLLRESSDIDGCVTVACAEEAVQYLAARTGKALLTVGAKELPLFAKAEGALERFYVRVLPLPESVEQCMALGFRGRHIIAMQGPFSAELNAALLRETGSTWLVTKESGDVGGFREKRQGALSAGANVIVIRRKAETGESLSRLLTLLGGKTP